MKKIYIIPESSVFVQQTESPLLSGSDDGNLYGAKHWNSTYAESYDDSEETKADVWPKQKSLWDE